MVSFIEGGEEKMDTSQGDSRNTSKVSEGTGEVATAGTVESEADGNGKEYTLSDIYILLSIYYIYIMYNQKYLIHRKH